jgi:GAF domain-containing protein
VAHIDPDALEAALTRISALDATTELGPMLDQVVHQVSTIFEADGAGLMVLDEQNTLRYVAASDDAARSLERAQEETGRGPCVDSLVNDVLVATSDLHTDQRWPELAKMMAGTPVRAVLGVPIHSYGAAIGSLNAYRTHPHTWNSGERRALEAFNRVVQDLVGHALLAQSRDRLARQLQHALDVRVVIDRAVGYLMARSDINAVDAFDQLRRTARSERRKVADVAREVLEGRALRPAK